jgi:hypothetical protein
VVSITTCFWWCPDSRFHLGVSHSCFNSCLNQYRYNRIDSYRLCAPLHSMQPHRKGIPFIGMLVTGARNTCRFRVGHQSPLRRTVCYFWNLDTCTYIFVFPLTRKFLASVPPHSLLGPCVSFTFFLHHYQRPFLLWGRKVQQSFVCIIIYALSLLPFPERLSPHLITSPALFNFNHSCSFSMLKLSVKAMKFKVQKWFSYICPCISSPKPSHPRICEIVSFKRWLK